MTMAEVRFYAEHGWLITEPVVAAAAIDETLRGLDQHWSFHRDRVPPGAGEYFPDRMPGDGDGTRNSEYISLQNELVSRLAWSVVIGEIAAATCGTSSVRLFDDQIVYKPGGQSEAVVGWHVDGDDWGTCSSRQMLTAWMSLHDCPEELGPLVVCGWES